MASTLDGRTARAQRTHDAIVDALFSLLEEDRLRPTAGEIAERAGVSERTVFQHFPNREALLGGVRERQSARVAAVVGPIDPALPAAERLDAFVAQRAATLELLTPSRRAGLLLAAEQPEVARTLDAVRARKREAALACFAPELAALPPERAAAVAAAASWNTWEALRVHQGLGVEEARAALRALLAGVLEISRE